MIAWFLETGLYLLGVALIPVVGLLLICWGLGGDRSKGRPRCPKCWYDMRGTVPSLACPECGHAPGSERRLYKTRRRWRPVVLGAVLVLLLSYPLTIVGGWCREQAAIQKLTKRGHAVAHPRRSGPGRLVGRLPERFALLFDRVTSVVLVSPATDVDMADLGRLSRLRTLRMNPGPALTDAGILHLRGLLYLEQLDLSRTQVTDAGLVHLKGLTGLRRLRLTHTQVTDAGLVHLRGLSQLQYLGLGGTLVTGTGFVHLTGLTNLRLLSLRDTQVTDSELVLLAISSDTC